MNFGHKFGAILKALSSLLVLMSVDVYSFEALNPASVAPIAVTQLNGPLAATNANWIFSGSVATENGDAYEYFFQAKRHQDAVEATVSLVDAQTKAVIFMQNAHTNLTDSASVQWLIGDIFLRYNAINRSWVFGLKKANQIGFNFKVDTLKQAEFAPQTKQVLKDVMMTVVQTGQVNGHIQLKEEAAAQFVSGKNAWFREVVLREASTKLPAMHGLLCHFNDGSGLYSMQILNSKNQQNSYAGSYNAAGIVAAVSKTIRVNQLSSGLWRVNGLRPKLQFDLSDLLQNQAVAMGFVDQKQKSGFCVIAKEDLA